MPSASTPCTLPCARPMRARVGALAACSNHSGQVRIGMALGERRSQHDKPERLEVIDHLASQRQPYVGWYGADALRHRPDAFIQRGIVIARDHDPGTAESLGGVEQTTNGAFRYGLQVEHIAGDQHRIHPMLGGQRGDALHRVDARIGQRLRVLKLKLAVLTADLPVSGMNEARHDGRVWRSRRSSAQFIGGGLVAADRPPKRRFLEPTALLWCNAPDAGPFAALPRRCAYAQVLQDRRAALNRPQTSASRMR